VMSGTRYSRFSTVFILPLRFFPQNAKGQSPSGGLAPYELLALGFASQIDRIIK
jgi:hypothetical protein